MEWDGSDIGVNICPCVSVHILYYLVDGKAALSLWGG